VKNQDDILGIIAEQKSNTIFTDLKNRIENDYDLWRLEPFQLGHEGEYENYTTNEPKTLANKTMEVLSTAPLQAEIPLLLSDEDERRRKSNTERFYYGILNLADSRLQNILQPSIQDQMAFFSTLRGWIVIRSYFRKTKDGKTIPDIVPWDILNVRWAIGADGLLYVFNMRPISKAQAKAEYNIDVAGSGVSTTLYDFWDDEQNSIVINDTFVKKPTQHGLDHIPVLIKAVGAVPLVQSERHNDTLKDQGDSVFGANRTIYDHKNKMITMSSTIVGLAAHNPLAISSSGGKKTFSKSPYYKGAVIQLDADKGEKVEGLYKPEIPQAMAYLYGIVQRDLSSGGIPPIAGGELDFSLPYSGIKELISAARSIVKPRQRAMEESFEWIFREMSTQYINGKFPKLKVHGRDGTEEYFDMQLSSKDISGDWFPECKLLPDLPENEPEKHAMAELAVRNDLLSPETARAKYLGVKDTDLEEQKVIRSKANKLPAVMIRELVLSLINDGRLDLANAVMKDYYTSMQQQQTKGRPQGEAVEPQFATGLPNTAVAPEVMGKVQGPDNMTGSSVAPI